MSKKKYKGGVAKSLFKNYFFGYISLIIIMFLIMLITFTSYFIYLFYQSSEKYESINYKLTNNYMEITEDELSEINGFLIVVDENNNVNYKCGNVIKEFEEIDLNYYLILFNSTIQEEKLGKIENYLMKNIESTLALIDLDTILIKSESGVEYSISYKFINHINKLIIFGVPYENINKYGNYHSITTQYSVMSILVVINILILLLLIYIFARWTSRKFVKPIKILNSGMESITAGAYGQQVNLKSNNEFGELTEGFNLMSKTIKDEKEENYRLQQERNKLILHISHDLKNPLAAILGYSEILTGENNLTEEEKAEYLKIISKNSKRSNKIITDLFEFSLLGSADYNLNLRKLDVNELLREILADYIPELEAKEFKYDFNISEEEYILDIDNVKFTRAISNLIDNAIKYNGRNTTLFVSSMICEDKVKIIIKDNGKGIDKDVREKIFDVFVREDKARNSSTGGTGLGLAITKAIIEKHSGDIYLVDSDKGTEYCITFNMR